jgi:hypothetical protein
MSRRTLTLLVLASLAACKKDDGTDDTDVVDSDVDTDVVDADPPGVTSTTPTSGGTEVDPDAVIRATFDEDLDAATVSSATVHLTDDIGAVVIGVTVAGGEVTITPSSRLRTRTAHTVTIDASVTDLAGNALRTPYAWTFTTGVATEALLPTVEYTLRDGDSDGTPDFYVGGGPPDRLLMAKKGETLKDRPVLEFPIVGITSDDAVSAMLSLAISNLDPAGDQSYLAIYGFSADGAASMADWSGGASLGSVFVSDSATPTTRDVTSAVNAALLTGATHVGFRLESDGVDRVSIYASDETTGPDAPTLTVTF